ncbi:MAG: hypothetical protein ACRDLV_01700 [Solirubrobacteraceae bacterium]
MPVPVLALDAVPVPALDAVPVLALDAVPAPEVEEAVADPLCVAVCAGLDAVDDEPEPHPATIAPAASAQSAAGILARARRPTRFNRLIIGRNGSWPRAGKVGGACRSRAQPPACR